MALPFEIFQVTVAYSNAVLVAIMPHISDFAKKLDLPIKQPVTTAEMAYFRCSPRSDHIGGRVVLTNGYEFVFDNGEMRRFASPRSYYELQNPHLIRTFYAPIKLTQEQAIQISHDAIKKLGYTDAMLFADRPPEIASPPRSGTNSIPRYRIRWFDPTWGGGGPNHLPTSVEFEVNATTGQIEMMLLEENPELQQTNIQVNVRPPVIGTSPETVYLGGRKMNPITPEYARAFLTAVLPQLSDFAANGNLRNKKPIFVADVDMARYLAKYSCGVVDGDVMATVDLKDGTQFVYRHGQVIAFYSDEAMERPDREWPQTFKENQKFRKRFYGAINMTTNDAVRLVRDTIRHLGYSESMLQIQARPLIVEPGWWGTNRIARCNIIWYARDDGEYVRTTRVSAEVDMTAKTLKSLYINDHANTNIWRKPPDIGIPLKTLPSEGEPPVPFPDSGVIQGQPPINPPVSMPPGMPLQVH